VCNASKTSWIAISQGIRIAPETSTAHSHIALTAVATVHIGKSREWISWYLWVFSVRCAVGNWKMKSNITSYKYIVSKICPPPVHLLSLSHTHTHAQLDSRYTYAALPSVLPAGNGPWRSRGQQHKAGSLHSYVLDCILRYREHSRRNCNKILTFVRAQTASRQHRFAHKSARILQI
jgi:hypothetical protein